VLQGGDQNLVRVVATVETIEEIGKQRPFQVPQNSGESQVPADLSERENN